MSDTIEIDAGDQPTLPPGVVDLSDMNDGRPPIANIETLPNSAAKRWEEVARDSMLKAIHPDTGPAARMLIEAMFVPSGAERPELPAMAQVHCLLKGGEMITGQVDIIDWGQVMGYVELKGAP